MPTNTEEEKSSQAEKKDSTTETDNKLISETDKSIFPINYFNIRCIICMPKPGTNCTACQCIHWSHAVHVS